MLNNDAVCLVVIRGKLIFARVGVSFENSDKGSNFLIFDGGSLTK